MLLILTNSQDVTADYLMAVLDKNLVPFVRFDTDRNLEATEVLFDREGPRLRLADQWFQPDSFTNIWYRRPERLKHPKSDDSPESKLVLDEWSESLEGFLAHVPRTRWMNHPACNVGASHKIEQLTTATKFGLEIPDTLVTHNGPRLMHFFERHGGEIIVKPLSVGYVDRKNDGRDSLIYTSTVSKRHLENLDPDFPDGTGLHV